MSQTSDLPELGFVRVLTPGGPYVAGSLLSLAFTSPTVARIASHDAELGTPAFPDDPVVVPETISVRVERVAGPYRTGDSLALSFVDPAIVRIHPIGARIAPPADVESFRATPAVSIACAQPQTQRADNPGLQFSEIPHESRPAGESNEQGVRVGLDWSRDRVRRFVQVVDKLFTVDRLGWYRHVFAMRLLVPDVVTCGDTQSAVEALRHLHALRAAAIETLGRPLLAAFMPNFSVTPDWLDSLDRPGAARALAGLRDALSPLAREDDSIGVDELQASWTLGALGKRELIDAPATSVEALLPIFIPAASSQPLLREHLSNYRATLLDIFGQTSQSGDAVRLNQMAQPNHTLDDRLWLLVGAVNESFGLAVA